MPFENQNLQTTSAEEQAEGMDMVGFLKRRKSFIIFLGLLGVGAGYLLFQKQIPKYRSGCWVQVIHRNSDPRLKSMVADRDLADADSIIKGLKTLEAAISKHNLGSLSTLRGVPTDEMTLRLAEMISTKEISPSVIQISVTGGDPADVSQIAQAVSDEFVAAQKENYKDASEDLKELLATARDEFHEKLKKAEEEYTTFREDSKLSNGGDNLNRLRAKAAQEKISSLELRRTELRAQLAQLQEAVDRGGVREALLLLIGKDSSRVGENNVAANQAVDASMDTGANILQALFPLMQQEAVLSAELGPDHPRLKQLQMQINMTREHWKQMAGVKAAGVATPDTESPPDFLSVYLQSLQEELLVIDRQERELQLFADSEEALARELMHDELEEANRKSEIGRLSTLFEETTVSISEIQVNAGMGGVTAQVLSPARHGVLVFPVIGQFLGLGAFLGALAGLLLGYVVEMADRSFRKPEEIVREFGVPIVGHIPFITESRMKAIPEGQKIDRIAVSMHIPRSRPAEAYRAVRTALCFGAFAGVHRVIQVTSATAGDGKSTLSLNLAISLAKSGKRTILVEGDFRRPKVHKLTGVTNEVGFVNVLKGDAELADAVEATAVENFFVLPCGKRPKDPSELLVKPEFEQILQVLREQYDYVIIDTPPVLAVTDPCGIASRVDAVLVCLRLSRHTRELGKRTLEQLRDVGATVAGIVINGVEERDAYGYGNYRYSDYQYYYANQNYSRNESLDNDVYYTDEPRLDFVENATESDSVRT